MTLVNRTAASAATEKSILSAHPSPYMLTLCELARPVSIRAPEQLKRFRFFTSRTRTADGAERLQLHMGYFESLADADRWANSLRGRYPTVVSARVPAQLLQ